MKLSQVSNLTEDQGRPYVKMLDSVKSLDDLRAALMEWDGLVDDAQEIVSKWTEEDFADFKKARAKERRGIFSGEENAKRFTIVMMPELMFKASMISEKFKAPWGLAVLRILEVKKAKPAKAT